MTKLSKSIKDYLALRNQMGYKLKNAKNVLNKFADYAKRKKRSYITSKLALDFATQNPKTSSHQYAVRLGIIRQFALYQQTIDPRTEVPSKYLLSSTYRRRDPYIYHDNEIAKLLDSCKILKKPHSLREKTYYTLFGLYAVTGMRTNEALKLHHDDVDLKKGIITIQESKFRKSRKIPLHSTTTKMLKKYARGRKRYFKNPTSQYFFVDNYGEGLKKRAVTDVFKKVCIAAGLRKKGEFNGPRIMDLRHTFAVKTLINNFKKNTDIDFVIPILSRYLGHMHPKNTYWYLTATPELLNLIILRLETKLEVNHEK